MRKGEIACTEFRTTLYETDDFNPLPDMPILGSSNSAANKDMMAKIWKKWGYNYLLKEKTLWEKEKLLLFLQCFQK